MSIINDALKKTQLDRKKPDKKQDNQGKQDSQINQNRQDDKSNINVYEKLYKDRQDRLNTATTQPAREERAPKKTLIPRRAKKWPKILFVIIFSLSCLSGGFFFAAHSKPLQNFFRSAQNNSTPAQVYIAQPGQEKQEYKARDLILNGTSLIDGKKVALINDEIYETGEIVNGKKITSIGLTKVELRDDQKTITLKVR